MRTPAIWLLIVGCVWALFVVWLFLTIAGTAGEAESIKKVVLYWGAMLVGPLSLIIGSALVLRGSSSRAGVVLVTTSCVNTTCVALYNAVTEFLRTPHALEPPPPYWLYIAMLLIMLVSDVAAYKIYRAAGGLR